MDNIKMWRHAKYYKELRKLRNNLDQVISRKDSTEARRRAPGPVYYVSIVILYNILGDRKPF